MVRVIRIQLWLLMKFLPLLLAIFSASCASFQSQILRRASALDPHLTRYVPSEGAEMQAALTTLTQTITAGGYTVKIVPLDTIVGILGAPAFGINHYPSRTIYLDEARSVNAQFETLAHEAGHMFHSRAIDRATAQVFAELVGAQVQAFYGSRTALTTSSDYLTHYKHAFAALRFLQKDMRRAVQILTNQAPWPYRFTEADEIP